MVILKVYDEYIQFLKWRWKNAQICCALTSAQLVITCAALGQHIFSFACYNDVFKCSFNETMPYQFLKSDIIIYDFGLFHRLWGIDKCIANYLDGGYMRFFWCINHVLTILAVIGVAMFVQKPKPIMLWPALTLQSVYAIGLLILSISSLPKFLPSIFEKLGRESSLPMMIYMSGASMNFFLTYILWHYYWYLEEMEKLSKLPTMV